MNISMETNDWSIGVYIGYKWFDSESMDGWTLKWSLSQGVYGMNVQCATNMYLGVL